MRVTQYIASFLLLAIATLVHAGEDDKGDEYGIFSFDASSMDFTSGAYYPKACISTSEGDFVVLDIFQSKSNNQCRRHSLGTYKVDITTFVVAYGKQQQQDKEKGEYAYELEDDVYDMLECQQYYYNNQQYYIKLGCKESTGKGFQVHAYSDAYCTQKASISTSYNLGGDISSLKVSFDTCKTCVTSSSQYGNNNNNYYQYFQYNTPLCSAAYNYKQTCGYSCKRAVHKAGTSSSHFGYSGDGFSGVGKFFLWVMSFTAIFFLLAALAQRKKMSKTDVVLEEAAIKSAGIEKKWIPRIFVAIAIVIAFLILFKRKILTWFFLTSLNVALLGYWVHLKNKTDDKAAISDYQMYGGTGGTTA